MPFFGINTYKVNDPGYDRVARDNDSRKRREAINLALEIVADKTELSRLEIAELRSVLWNGL